MPSKDIFAVLYTHNLKSTRIVRESVYSPLQCFHAVKDNERKRNSDIKQGHNYVTNKPKKRGINPNIDSVYMNEYLKFSEILNICSSNQGYCGCTMTMDFAMDQCLQSDAHQSHSLGLTSRCTLLRIVISHVLRLQLIDYTPSH